MLLLRPFHAPSMPLSYPFHSSDLKHKGERGEETVFSPLYLLTMTANFIASSFFSSHSFYPFFFFLFLVFEDKSDYALLQTIDRTTIPSLNSRPLSLTSHAPKSHANMSGLLFSGRGRKRKHVSKFWQSRLGRTFSMCKDRSCSWRSKGNRNKNRKKKRLIINENFM